MRTFNTLFLFFYLFSASHISAQDCVYPVIFLHGWTGSELSWQAVYEDPDFIGIWGNLTDVFQAVVNATEETHIWGADQIQGTGDDDVLVQFVNENNTLLPGCVYAINFQNFWNEDPNNAQLIVHGCDSPSPFDSDSNESAILKQGYALGKCIEKVLAANPGKDRVILVAHSMGGLEAREYLQRRTPEQPSGTPRWWVYPNQAGGHRVAKLVTMATPHRGSNTLGNISPAKEPGPEPNQKDGLPDLASEAVRDLRYSYGCGFLNLFDCPGVYLFGGDENDFSVLPYPFWNEDVDCDGDETSPNVIGINIDGTTQGFSEIWHGTYDNPDIPLPTDLRYTYVTSDIVGDTGDGVVALSRQWLYDGSQPAPSDGTAHRLTDTLLTDVFHTSVNDDPNLVARSMDEGDYPQFEWRIQPDKLYFGMVQVRATQAPEAPHTDDPDWFTVSMPASLQGDITLQLTPQPNLAGKLDFFLNPPADYTDMSVSGDYSLGFSSGASAQSLTIPQALITPGATYYFRILHQGVGYADWKTPYTFILQTLVPMPLDWLSFEAKVQAEDLFFNWHVANEQGIVRYELQAASRDLSFHTIATNSFSLSANGNYSLRIPRSSSLPGPYFRIAAIEQGGKRSYSPLRHLPEAMPLQLLSYGPNPAGPDGLFRFRLLTESSSPISLEIRDAPGHLLSRQQWQPRPGSTHEGQFDFSALPHGLYLLTWQQANQRIVVKVGW